MDSVSPPPNHDQSNIASHTSLDFHFPGLAGGIDTPSRWHDFIRSKLRIVARRYHLSETECETAFHLIDGHSAEAIARARHLSIATVRTHLANIRGKLFARSSLEAMAILFKACFQYDPPASFRKSA